MQTLVKVHLHMTTLFYRFDMDRSTFLDKYENHVRAVGFYTGVDIRGSKIVLTPSNCAVIEIIEEE